jgi:hypothetical protein
MNRIDAEARPTAGDAGLHANDLWMRNEDAEAGPAPKEEYEQVNREGYDPGRLPGNAGNFNVPARGLAIVSAVLALACLVSLAVVASIEDADGLSTVALALAILAFAIQIVVYIAQANTATQQMVRSEQLNSDTGALDRLYRASRFQGDDDLVFAEPDTGEPLRDRALARATGVRSKRPASTRRTASTTCAIPSAPRWRRPAWRRAPCRSGWDTGTCRRPSCMPTTRPARTRPRWSPAPSNGVPFRVPF